MGVYCPLRKPYRTDGFFKEVFCSKLLVPKMEVVRAQTAAIPVEVCKPPMNFIYTRTRGFCPQKKCQPGSALHRAGDCTAAERTSAVAQRGAHAATERLS